MHRFFVDPEQIEGDTVRFQPEQAHQIRRVLRMRTGDRVLVLDGQGSAYEVVLERIGPEDAAGAIADQRVASGEPRVHLTLYQSLLKRDKFEWVLQKGTEIGVSRFVPVISSRTLVRDADTVTPEKMSRWRRIITEAAEQARRGQLPQLREPVQFTIAVAQASDAERALIAWEEAGQRDLRAALADLGGASAVALFIGPEGGYDATEVELAQAHGVRPVSFGPRILRTETAGLIGPALILYELGDMGR